MKTFLSLFEEISKQTEEDLSVDDVQKISAVVERLKEISSEASDLEPEEIVDEIESALSEFGLTFDKEEALEALSSDKRAEISLHASGEENPFVVSAIDDETGEEIPGDMVLALHKDGDGIYAKVHVYFDDPEPEPLDDLQFHIPDEDESEEEKEKEAAEGNYEDYPADEDTEYETVDGERRPVGGRTNQLGGVEEEDEEETNGECDCEDKDNCTCGKGKKLKKDEEDSDEGEGGGEHQARVSGNASEVTKKGAVEVYESKFYEMESSKYACVHIKNHKLRVDIIDHPLDAYHMGLSVVGKVIEIKPEDVHETYARMHKLKKEDQAAARAKKKKIEEKTKTEMLKDSKVESPVATGKKSPVINDIMNKDDQEKFKKHMEVKESLPEANTEIVNVLDKNGFKKVPSGISSNDVYRKGDHRVTVFKKGDGKSWKISHEKKDKIVNGSGHKDLIKAVKEIGEEEMDGDLPEPGTYQI